MRDSRRLGAVTGATVFILALLAQLARVEPALALLVALGAGCATGIACATAAGAFRLLRQGEVPAPRRLPRAAAPAEMSQGAEAGAETAELPVPPPSDAAAGAARMEDLQQTVRLDASGLDAVLGEDLAAELARARAEALLPEASAPLAEPGSPSENVGESTST
jgi:hypothetical protein